MGVLATLAAVPLVVGWGLARMGWWWAFGTILTATLCAAAWFWTQIDNAEGYGGLGEMLMSGMGAAAGVGLMQGALVGRQ